MKKRRFSNEVNAGSMADIAFLLLIFFLVTTTIETEKGIKIKLPRWEADKTIEQIADRNVLSIYINAQNKLMVEKRETPVDELRNITKQFISNPEKSKDKPSQPKNALVALKNDRETTYLTYVMVYNELKAAYNELWEEKAQSLFHKSYASLKKKEQIEIRAIIPLVISESEPSAFQSPPLN